MRRLLLYLIMVLGFSLAFNINAYSSVYCVDVKIEERIKKADKILQVMRGQ